MDAEDGSRLSIEQARVEIAGGGAKALDVRDGEQWSAAHVSGAIHLPRERLSSGLEALDPEAPLIVFAEDDGSADEVAATLREAGFDAAVAEGGMDAWISEGYKTQPTEDPDDDTELGGGSG